MLLLKARQIARGLQEHAESKADQERVEWAKDFKEFEAGKRAFAEETARWAEEKACMGIETLERA